MDTFGLVVALVFAILYSVGISIAFIIVMCVNRKRGRTITALRKQVARIEPKPTNIPVPPKQQPQSVPRVPVQNTPVPQSPKTIPESPATPPKQGRISSINITFAVGVLLLTIVGAVFISSTWKSIVPAARAAILFAIVLAVFLLSFISGKLLKLRQTGFAFFCLGSFLLPIAIFGVGALRLFGDNFSFAGGTGLLVSAVALLSLCACGIAGFFIYKSGVYAGISYFGFTWGLLFLSSQIGYEIGGIRDAFCGGFVALAFLSLVCQILNLTNLKAKIRFFKIYSLAVTIIAAVCSLIFVFDGRLIDFIAIVFVWSALFLMQNDIVPKWISPIAAAPAIVLLMYCFEGSVFVYLSPALALAMYRLYIRAKRASVLSDLLIPTVLSLAALCIGGVCVFSGVCLLAAFVMFGDNVLDKRKVSEYVSIPLFFITYAWGFAMLFDAILDDRIALICNAGFAAFAGCIMVFPFVLVSREGKKLHAIAVSASYNALLHLIIAFMASNGRQTLYPILCSVFAVIVVVILAVTETLMCKRKPNIPFVAVVACGINILVLPIYAIAQDLHVIYLPLAAAFLVASFICIAPSRKLSAEKQMLKFFTFAECGLWTLFSIGEYSDTAAGKIACILLTAFLYVVIYMSQNTICGFIPVLLTLVLAVRCGWDLSFELYFRLMFALTIILNISGRILHATKIFDKKSPDFLTILSPVFAVVTATAYTKTFYVEGLAWTLFFFLMAVIAFNCLGRVKFSSRVVLAIASVFITLGIICQGLIHYPSEIILEIQLIIILLDIWIIRYVIKPGSPKTMRFIWFAAVAACLALEGISAAVTGQPIDLLIVGTAAIVMFIYSFIRKEKSWFVLSLVTIFAIAVYLSITFWSSLIWMFYLLIAGVILIVTAAVNEYMKRMASSDGKKKRLFEEWKW